MFLFGKIASFIMIQFSLFVSIVLSTCCMNLLTRGFLILHVNYEFYVFVLCRYPFLYAGCCLMICEAYFLSFFVYFFYLNRINRTNFMEWNKKLL